MGGVHQAFHIEGADHVPVGALGVHPLEEGHNHALVVGEFRSPLAVGAVVVGVPDGNTAHGASVQRAVQAQRKLEAALRGQDDPVHGRI